MSELDPTAIAEEAARKVLAEAKAAAEAGDPKPQAMTSFAELLADGKHQEAFDLVSKHASAEALRGVAPVITAQIAAAREKFRSTIGDQEFSEWLPLIEAEAKRFKIDLSTLLTAEQWQEAFNFTRSKHLDKVEAKIRDREHSRVLQELEQTGAFIGGGSLSGATPEHREAMAALDARDREAVSRLEFDPKAFAASKQFMNRFADDQGGFTDCPILDRDYDSVVNKKTATVQPGKF